jgi:hypothetical protein
MARSLILVGLAIVMIGASPTHPETNETNRHAQQERAGARPIATLGNQPRPVPSGASIRTDTYNYYYPTTKSESPPVWFQEITTGALIAFTIGLWWTSVRQWEALRAALDVNRPFLIVSDIIPSLRASAPMENKPWQWAADIIFENGGSGPADVLEFIATASGFDNPFRTIDSKEPETVDYPSEFRHYLHSPLIPAGNKGEQVRIVISMDPNSVSEMKTNVKRLAVYGVIKYRGGPKTEYWSRFFWWHWMPDSNGERGHFTRASTPGLNERS